MVRPKPQKQHQAVWIPLQVKILCSPATLETSGVSWRCFFLFFVRRYVDHTSFRLWVTNAEPMGIPAHGLKIQGPLSSLVTFGAIPLSEKSAQFWSVAIRNETAEVQAPKFHVSLLQPASINCSSWEPIAAQSTCSAAAGVQISYPLTI